MNRRPLSSSNLASAGWEPEAEHGTLEVEFRSGWIYHYDNVPEGVYQALIGSTSAGTYFDRHIDGTYPHRRISRR